MIEAVVLTATEEEELLKEWFETVHFDEESSGIPELSPERDDEESRALVDADAITDWFRHSPDRSIPVDAMNNDYAWTYVDWDVIGMAPSVARSYMEGEARFQELSRANPYHSKKNGQFTKGPGGGSSAAPKETWVSKKIGTSTVWKNGDHKITNMVNSGVSNDEVEKHIIPTTNALMATNPISGPVDIRIVKKVVYPDGTSSGGMNILGTGKIKISGGQIGGYTARDINNTAHAPAALKQKGLMESEVVLVHEWGHGIDRRNPSNIGKEFVSNKTVPAMKSVSRYGEKNSFEAYAENFSEYYLSKGQTTDPVVQAAAKEFGWKH